MSLFKNGISSLAINGIGVVFGILTVILVFILLVDAKEKSIEECRAGGNIKRIERSEYSMLGGFGMGETHKTYLYFTDGSSMVLDGHKPIRSKCLNVCKDMVLGVDCSE